MPGRYNMGCALLAGLGRELQRFIGAKLQPAFPGTVGNDRLLARALWLALNGDDFRISIDAPAPLRNPISLATTDTAIVKPFLQLRILLGRRASSLTLCQRARNRPRRRRGARASRSLLRPLVAGSQATRACCARSQSMCNDAFCERSLPLRSLRYVHRSSRVCWDPSSSMLRVRPWARATFSQKLFGTP
jgi:hypothetical protein